MLLARNDLSIAVVSILVYLTKVNLAVTFSPQSAETLRLRCNVVTSQGCAWLRFDKFPMSTITRRQQQQCCVYAVRGQKKDIMPSPIPFFDALVMSVLKGEYPRPDGDPSISNMRSPFFYSVANLKTKNNTPRVGKRAP